MEDTLRLQDGRTLGYGIYGNLRGLPIFDFHGIPGSRREAALIAASIGREDLCLIGFDRPGYGRSSPQPRFQITDLPGDAAQLADHLGIERFAALGYSGGGPFALACAAQLPGRITTLWLVSAVGPAATGSQGMHQANREKFNLARHLPWLARGMLWLAFSGLRRDPQRLERQLRRIWQQMPEPDRRVFAEDPRFAESILEITRDAVLRGVSGWVNEELLMAAPWGFEPGAARCPRVLLWHGEQDRNVPLAMGRALAAQIPNCQATFLEGEGHISLLYRHGAEIVDAIAQTS